MMARHAQNGRVTWIGLRRSRREPMDVVSKAMAHPGGLEGDHAPEGKRAVTLFQAEHLPVIAALLGRDLIEPDRLRRNILVEGLNLLGARHKKLKLGEAILHIEGPCPPCSRMEEALGHGGYTAVRGHGGVYASVVQGGRIAIGDRVEPIPQT